MNKLNYINDIEKILNNLGMNEKMIADKLRKCEKYESAGLEPEQIKYFLKDFGISVVMRNTKLMNELKEYKDLEEQGLLIKLPCKVGDMVYLIHEVARCERTIEPVKFGIALYGYFNKTVFLTREEAEKALEEMEGK